MSLQRITRWFSAGAAAGALLLGGLVAGSSAPAAEKPADGVERISSEIATLEKKAAELGRTGDHAGAAGLLDRAAEKQRLRLQLDPEVNAEQKARLERLIVARDNERAQTVAAQLDAIEEAADAARKAGRPDLELQKLREGLKLQRAVDDSGAADRFKNFSREMSLAQAVQNAEAAPLAHELEAALRDARAAAAAQRWADAATAYARVRARRTQLARDFARTPFADPATLGEIDAELTAFAPAGAAAEVDRREKQGDDAASGGHEHDAADSYTAARDGQIKLNADFAGSRFASPQRVEQLEIKRESVLAAELLARARALDRTAAAHLSRREAFAAERDVAAAIALLETVEKDFPQARDFDGGLKIKLAYLQTRGAELGALQDLVYDRLVPAAERADLLMFGVPVPQALYAKVMNTNPSRNNGDARPVDSVSWIDAQEFCRRLSWVLGCPVRLPAAAEWRAARDIGAIANRDGFKEWLAADAGETTVAPVAGGREAVGSAPEKVDRTRRARDVSFRVVVEYPLE